MMFGRLVSKAIPAICDKGILGSTVTISSNTKLVQWKFHQGFTQKRSLHLHEYINLNILKDAGVSVPRGIVASTPEEAQQAAEKLGLEDVMVKAQVLTGGRGKGKFMNGFEGGVKRAFSPEETADLASKMIGQYLVTKQTGEKGILCNKVLVAERIDTRKEYYFSVMMDRRHAGPLLIGSSEGGVNIEEIAETKPDAIIQMPIDIHTGVDSAKAQEMAAKMGFRQQYIDHASETIQKLYGVFMKKDVTMLEINPLSEIAGGKVVCMDCKVSIDDNAFFRQKDLFAQRDLSQEDARESEADKIGLNYITLDGDIGCLVNGAGLAMATMDIIKLHGGSPANFLDVGGGASVDQIMAAFQLITSGAGVNAILVNIFGGIVRCDSVALGIIKAAEKLHLDIPIVARLQGTNLREAIDLMEASTIKIHPCPDLDEAAMRVVKMAAIKQVAKDANINIEFTLPM